MCPAPRFSFAEQEQLIIESSAVVIQESSLLDFKMSAIAKQAGISMGSVYKHVQSKEDVLMALATHLFEHMQKIFGQILKLPLTTPQICIAINLTDPDKVNRFSFDRDLESLIVSDPVLARCSPGWKTRMLNSSKQIDDMCYQLLADAAQQGELICSDIGCPNSTEEQRQAYINQLNMGWWAMSVGFKLASQHKNELERLVGNSSPSALFSPMGYQMQNLKAFFNTFNWQTPLTDNAIVQTCEVLEAHQLR